MVDTAPISESGTSVSLPDFFPQQNLVVEREEHRFDVFEGNDGPEAQTEYGLTKAPVDEIIRVTGSYESSTIEFTKGVDYTLNEENTAVVWNTDGRTPTAGTTFFVTYESDAILKRYLDASNDEIEITQDAIVESINSKFIDTSSGDNLDRIGNLFGEIVGDRRGKTDEEYRTYLKSAVQSFVSRGTKDGIRLSVSSALGLPLEKIQIEEDFEESAYYVFFKPDTEIRTSTITEVADIADPSGVEYLGAIVGIDRDGPEFVEGPEIDIEEAAEYDSFEQVPSDFIDPVSPKERIVETRDIFEESVEKEIVETYTYDWAHQQITVNSVGSGNSWNEFQWGGDWGSPKEVDVEIVGRNWDFVDWNFIPSQGTFGAIGDNAETQGISDSQESRLFDRSDEDTVETDDNVIVRFLVGEEESSINDEQILELTLDAADTTGANDGATSEVEITSQTNAKINDTTQTPQAETTADIASSNDDAVYEVTELQWETNWSDLYWTE